MSILRVHHLQKSFGAELILDDISMEVREGEHVAVIGSNGCGKSTLLRLLIGELSGDTGTIHWKNNSQVGYLPQEVKYRDHETLQDYLNAAMTEIRALETKIYEVTQEMSTRAAEDTEELLKFYGDLSEQFEARGGYDLETRLAKVMTGLGLDGFSHDHRRLADMSGGERARLALTGLLIKQPDVLLLDEPTNHLDRAMLTWLEEYLSQFPGAIVMICHDRQFINRTIHAIYEIDEHSHRITAYAGNYDFYLGEKSRARERWLAEYQEQQAEIQTLQARMAAVREDSNHAPPPSKDKNKMAYNGHRHKVERVQTRNLKNAEQRLARVLDDPVPRPPEPMRFKASIKGGLVRGAVAFSMTDVAYAISPSQTILSDVRFSVGRKEHVLIIGENGSGKSTLLALLEGSLQPTNGSVFRPRNAKIGFLRQENAKPDPEQTLLEAFRTGRPGEDKTYVAKLLAFQLFPFEVFHKPLQNLSPGQMRKLQLAKLMDEDCDVLLVDEPTNHVAFDVMEEFERALNTFNGPVVAVSHDRWFIDHFEGTVYELTGGKLAAKDKPVDKDWLKEIHELEYLQSFAEE